MKPFLNTEQLKTVFYKQDNKAAHLIADRWN